MSRLIPNRALLAFLLIGLSASGLVQAQHTIYTERSTFDAANPGLATEGFEGGTPQGASGVCGFAGPVDSTGDGTCFLSGDLLPGASYNSVTATGTNMVRLGPGITPGLSSNAIAANFFSDTTELTFTEPGNNAVGFDMFCPSDVGAVVSVYGAGGLITQESTGCGPTTPTFFGISATEDIQVITIAGNSDGGEIIDDLSFGAADTPEPTATARFAVSKDFSDNNSSPVTVTISCNAGLPLEQTFEIVDGDQQQGGSFAPGFDGVTFVVTDFPDGGMDCTVTEIQVDGYTVDYAAGGSSSSTSDADGCHFSSVGFGDTNTCDIGNTLEGMTYTVNKVWGEELAEVDFALEAEVNLECENIRETADGDLVSISTTLTLDESTPSAVQAVFPNFGTPASRCRAVEAETDGRVVSDQGCADWLAIPVGSENASCTITNTMFFEGVPTLNQFGLAVLALLSLFIGLIGVRRMV